MFKTPTEKDISTDKKLSPAQTVRALYSAQWRFYKLGYDTLLKMVAVQFIIIIVLGLALLFFSMAGMPEPKYIAVNAQGQIIPLAPLSEKRVPDQHVRQFVTDALLETFNFHYGDYPQRLEKASLYYTDEGYRAIVQALNASGLFEQMKQKKLLMRTTLVSTPTINLDQTKNYGGVYIWVLDVELNRTLFDAANELPRIYKYRVLVRQMPLHEKSHGLAIYSIKEVSASDPTK